MRNLKEVKKEVAQMRDSLGMGVDPKVKELVIGLRRWGINTLGSCQGHHNRASSFPWVDVPIKQARLLAKIVSWQNRPNLPNGKPNVNTWVLRPGANIRLFPDNRQRPLEEMQKDAIEFGLFLQNLPDDWDK